MVFGSTWRTSKNIKFIKPCSEKNKTRKTHKSKLSNDRKILWQNITAQYFYSPSCSWIQNQSTLTTACIHSCNGKHKRKSDLPTHPHSFKYASECGSNEPSQKFGICLEKGLGRESGSKCHYYKRRKLVHLHASRLVL